MEKTVKLYDKETGKILADIQPRNKSSLDEMLAKNPADVLASIDIYGVLDDGRIIVKSSGLPVGASVENLSLWCGVGYPDGAKEKYAAYRATHNNV